MAHKAMIGGKAYEVSGGKTMVGGKVYSIANGKTMVDGKAYEIAFGGEMITVTISGTGGYNYCYVTINGTKYYRSATLQIEPGTVISAYVGGLGTKKITLNGKTVATSGTYELSTDNYTSVSIELSGGNSVSANCTITITAS